MNSIAIFSKSVSKSTEDRKDCYLGRLIDKLGKGGDDSSEAALTEKPISLHVNLWKVRHCGVLRLSTRIYLDIGLMIDASTSEIVVYFPFNVETPTDLGNVLFDQNVLGALFNAEMFVDSASDPNYRLAWFNETSRTEDPFYIYKLGETNFSLESSGGKEPGTIIKIKLDPKTMCRLCYEDKKDSKRRFYIRFRVKISNTNDIRTTERLSNDLIQTAFSKCDLYDFRVNEKRGVPSKTLEQMRMNGFNACVFDKVHVFYITETREDVHNGSTWQKDTRLIQDEVWKTYLPDKDFGEIAFLAYHWSHRGDGGVAAKDLIPSFRLFFCSKYPDISFDRLIVYVFVAILLSACGSFLCNKHSSIDTCVGVNNCGYWVLAGMLLVILGYLIYQNVSYKPGSIRRKR